MSREDYQDMANEGPARFFRRGFYTVDMLYREPGHFER